MPRLDLIVPHYTEPIELMQPMMDILRLQRNVDFGTFRVLVVCDGEDIKLPAGYGDDMPFEVASITIPHGGISAARNAGMDASRAEWIMFCDSDDAFLTTVSLQTFYKFMDPKKAMVASAFMEETLRGEKPMLLWHDGKDHIFVHGKMFRRQWLVDNNIRFNDKLILHEDSYFIAFARFLLGDNDVTFIKDAMYLWQWNPNSVTRRQPNFVLSTYEYLCQKNSAMVDELLRRGMYVQAKAIVCRTVTDAWNNFQRKSWNKPGNEALIADAEDCVALFYQRYKYIFDGSGEREIKVGLETLRDKLLKSGDLVEPLVPFDKWLEKLKTKR